MNQDVFYILMFVLWVLIIIGAIIVEINTVQQVGFATAIGAVVALIIHTFKSAEYWPEFVGFITTWIISWLVLFLVFHKMKKQVHDPEDGYLAFLGQEAKAFAGNENTEYGFIKFGDRQFRFKSVDQIKKGEVVIVQAIKGVTMQVVKKDQLTTEQIAKLKEQQNLGLAKGGE